MEKNNLNYYTSCNNTNSFNKICKLLWLIHPAKTTIRKAASIKVEFATTLTLPSIDHYFKIEITKYLMLPTN